MCSHSQKLPMSEISYPSIAHNVEIKADHAIAFGYNFNPSFNVMLCSLSVAEAALANISLTAFSFSLAARLAREGCLSSSPSGVCDSSNSSDRDMSGPLLYEICK